MMKLLLTSAGINNTSIRTALVDLLGKPIAESSALCIPTASYAMGGPALAWAAGLPVPGYAIDDQTAIKVTDGSVEVVSEGHWKLFTP
jgi:hypothetical protein